MKRREFVALLGGVALTWPVGSRAQQAGRPPTIGWFGSGTAAAGNPWVAAFFERLGQLGWVGSRTVAIEYRWAEGREERFAGILEEFIRLKVDVIVTYGNTAATAAKRMTEAVPIVFAAAGDPIGTGLVASLARPGGNLTGLSIQQTDLAGKRLEMLRETIPTLQTLGVLGNTNSPNVALEMREAESEARKLGLEVVTAQVRKVEDLEGAFEGLRGKAGAVYACSDPVLTTNRVLLGTLALRAGLPIMHGFREYAEAGGLISYGPHFPDLFRRAAEYVDKILRGTKPSELPVEQPTKFELVINLKTAKALGLTIPPSLIARADELIE
jgi:putative tryptophan/tyrosine transport system substrate-binding protein